VTRPRPCEKCGLPVANPDPVHSWELRLFPEENPHMSQLYVVVRAVFAMEHMFDARATKAKEPS
jgi:hypothetical protein